MSIEYLNAALDCDKLRGAKKSVLVSLCNMANRAGFCFPSMDYIALNAGVTRRTVISAIQALEEDGFIVVVRQHKRVNKYIVLLEKLSTISEFVSPKKVIHNSEIDAKMGEIDAKIGEMVTQEPLEPKEPLRAREKSQKKCHYSTDKVQPTISRHKSKKQTGDDVEKSDNRNRRQRNRQEGFAGLRAIRKILTGIAPANAPNPSTQTPQGAA